MAEELIPQVQGYKKKLEVAGFAIVTLASAGIVILGGLAAGAAAGVAIVAIALVNLVPVAARKMAMMKQRALTAITEEYSEETLREDERREAERVTANENEYATIKAELDQVVHELNDASTIAKSPQERDMITQQIEEVKRVLQEKFADVESRQADLVELRRVNDVLIPMDRAARAMLRANREERNPEERQRLIEARQAIKVRMGRAVAKEQVSASRRATQGSGVPALGRAVPETLDVSSVRSPRVLVDRVNKE